MKRYRGEAHEVTKHKRSWIYEVPDWRYWYCPAKKWGKRAKQGKHVKGTNR